MKKKLFGIILIILFSGNYAHAQWPNETDTMYWYYLKMDIIKDSSYNRVICNLTKVYPDIFSGTRDDYLKFQKDKMKTGYVVIGPFQSKEATEKSIFYFSNCNEEFVMREEQDKAEYYWYIVDVNKVKKDGAFEFRRQPAAVATGSIKGFKNILFYELIVTKIVISPFTNQLSAEYSKFLNRQLKPKRYKEKRYVNYGF